MTPLRSTVLCIVITLLAASVGVVHAQTSSTPEDVASRYIAAISSNDWEAASRFMHPEALDNLKRIFSEIASLDSSNAFIPLFFGDETTPESFRQMPPHQVFSRLMTSLVNLRPEIGEAMGNTSGTIIGHVMEGEDVAHVVYRMNTGLSGVGVTKVSVISMKRHNDGWLLLLSGDIQNMAEAMRQSLQYQETESPGESEYPEYDEPDFDDIPPQEE